MKSGKNPTMRQKKLMESRKLNYKNWLVVKDVPEYMEVVHRISGNVKRCLK